MMERSTRASTIVIAVLILWIAPAMCLARQQSPASTASPIPQPRPWPGTSSTPVQAQPRPSPTTPATPAVQPGRAQGAGTLPSPLLERPPITGEREALDIVRIKPAPLEPTDFRFPINLATALRLADARPLIVAAAQATVWVAEAQLTRAKVIWVPMLNVGFDYTRHDGGGPDFNKGIMTAPSVNFFYGGGGLIANVPLTDAYFAPLVARQILNAQHATIQTAKNDALQMTADTYFLVHQFRGQYAGALYCVERGHDLVERIRQLSREFVPTVEVDRARNLVADLEQQATSARIVARPERRPHASLAA